jgi:hypothetical protein
MKYQRHTLQEGASIAGLLIVASTEGGPNIFRYP